MGSPALEAAGTASLHFARRRTRRSPGDYTPGLLPLSHVPSPSTILLDRPEPKQLGDVLLVVRMKPADTVVGVGVAKEPMDMLLDRAVVPTTTRVLLCQLRVPLDLLASSLGVPFDFLLLSLVDLNGIDIPIEVLAKLPRCPPRVALVECPQLLLTTDCAVLAPTPLVVRLSVINGCIESFLIQCLHPTH
jgi:hypothetical protein